MHTRSKTRTVDFDKACEQVNAEGMVDGVTADNWGYKVECFTVARQPRHPQDWSITLSPAANPYEWGAWIAYCKQRKVMAVALGLDKMFRAELEVDLEAARRYHWYFPAKLPSFFDADWHESKDKLAGENFVRWIKNTLDYAEQMADALLDKAKMVTQTSPKKEAFPWED